MKLTKEQILKIYASFDVKIIWNESKAIDGIHYNDEIDFVNDLYPISTLIHSLRCDNEQYWKYILRPLSSLTEEQEINGERFVPMERLNELFGYKEMRLVYYSNDGLGWSIDPGFANTAVGMSDMWEPIEWCLENHFNVFNLPEDEYVDINSLNK